MGRIHREIKDNEFDLQVPVGQATLGRKLGETGPNGKRIGLNLLIRGVVGVLALVNWAASGFLAETTGKVAAAVLLIVVLYPLRHLTERMAFYEHGIVCRGKTWLFRTPRVSIRRASGSGRFMDGWYLWLDGMDKYIDISYIQDVDGCFTRYYILGGSSAADTPEDDHQRLAQAAARVLPGSGSYRLVYGWEEETELHVSQPSVTARWSYIFAFRRGELAVIPIQFFGKEIVPEEPVRLTPGMVGQVETKPEWFALRDRQGNRILSAFVWKSYLLDEPGAALRLRQTEAVEEFEDFLAQFRQDAAAAPPETAPTLRHRGQVGREYTHHYNSN